MRNIEARVLLLYLNIGVALPLTVNTATVLLAVKA
jgi:hypothetical protein